MARIEQDSEEAIRIDLALANWRQGDLTLGERWFIHAADPQYALTAQADQAQAPGLTTITSEVEGLVVLTQTCDILRNCVTRPFVEVCPLVIVDERILAEASRGQRPNLAFIPAVALRFMVANLDSVMTVEKSVVATWQRTIGWQKEAEGRSFAEALSRKRARFAFPNDFNEMVSTLRSRMVGKHDKNSPEGRALRSLREIRVMASSDWNDDKVDLHFWFLRENTVTLFEDMAWDELLSGWLRLVPSAGRFVNVGGVVTTLSRLTAEEYVQSDPLDLEYLSSGT